MNKVLLGDVAKEHKESIKENKKGMPIVGLEHLIPQSIRLEKWNIDVDNTFTKVFRKGNVLFGRRRAYLKKAAYAHFDGICSGDITVIEATPEKILPELLPFIIQNDDLFDFAVGKSAGSLSPRVKWEHLSQYSFYLPKDIDEQKILADLLWSIQDTVDAYKDYYVKAEALIKSMISDFIKSKNEIVKLSYYCVTDIESTRQRFVEDDDIFYIEISSIDNEINEVVEPTQMLLKDAPDSAKQVLKQGDVLVSLVRPNLKKIAVNNFPYNNVIGTSGFCVLRPNERSTTAFLEAVVLSDDFTLKMVSSVTGSTYPTIKSLDVLNYEVPLLNEGEIKYISEIMNTGNQLKEGLLNSISELKSSLNKIIINHIQKEE